MAKEDKVEAVEKAPKVSEEKARRLALVDAYAKQNPAKYEIKKAQLQKWVEEA